MNKEEILAMEAGFELDELVAIKVMGREHNKTIWSQKPFSPSTDLSAAWEVVEKFDITKFNLNYLDSLNFFGEGWHCKIDEQHAHECKTAPEAISKAALLAVMDL